MLVTGSRYARWLWCGCLLWFATLFGGGGAHAQNARGVDPGKALSEFRGRRWAVVVGISRYQDPAIPGLEYADRDAQAVYDFLVSPRAGLSGFEPDHVRLLLNEQASNEAIHTALRTFLRRSTPNDVVVVYFAGHGAPEPDPTNPKDQDLSELYLYANDTRTDNVRVTAYEMDDVQRDVGRVHARGLMLFVDACHSAGIGGQTRKRGDGAENQINRAFLDHLESSTPSKVSFTASEATQVSREDRRWGGGHGVFTYYLLRALAGEADVNKDNVVTLGETLEFVRDGVRRETQNKQVPTISQTAYDREWPVAVVLSPTEFAATRRAPVTPGNAVAIDEPAMPLTAVSHRTPQRPSRTPASAPADLPTDSAAISAAMRERLSAGAAAARTGAAGSGDRASVVARAPWLTCNSNVWTCAMDWLYPTVRRVRYGAAESALDHVLDLADLEKSGGVRETVTGAKFLYDIIVRPGSPAVYVQLEFADGSRSDVRRAVVPPARIPQRTVVFRARESGKDPTAPQLFALYMAGRQDVEFIPDVGPAVTRVEYTFDNGGFLSPPPPARANAHVRQISFRGSASDTLVRLRAYTGTGTVVGPFTYTVRELAGIPRELSKTMIGADVLGAVQCTRVTAPPLPDTSGGPQHQRSFIVDNEYTKAVNALNNQLSIRGLLFAKHQLPTVACRPPRGGRVGRVSEDDFASAVQEVWAGTEQGNLTRVARFDFPAPSRGLSDTRRSSEPPWSALLPASASAVYVRLVYRDGTRTDETRIPIDEFHVRFR